MSDRARAAIRLLAVLAVLCSARRAFADGVPHHGGDAIVVCLALFVVAPILGLFAWLMWRLWRRALVGKPAASTPRQWVAPPPELPVARTVKDSRPVD
jgi:hypothetical protein